MRLMLRLLAGLGVNLILISGASAMCVICCSIMIEVPGGGDGEGGAGCLRGGCEQAFREATGDARIAMCRKAGFPGNGCETVKAYCENDRSRCEAQFKECLEQSDKQFANCYESRAKEAKNELDRLDEACKRHNSNWYNRFVGLACPYDTDAVYRSFLIDVATQPCFKMREYNEGDCNRFMSRCR